MDQMHRFKIKFYYEGNRIGSMILVGVGAIRSPNNPKKKECHLIPHSTLGKARDITVEGQSVISILSISL